MFYDAKPYYPTPVFQLFLPFILDLLTKQQHSVIVLSMAKLKNPLLSLGAVGRLAKALTYTRRRKTNILESTPIPYDARSAAQLSWRHMYQKAVALWHALSAAEKQEWESDARPRHMIGFAWFMSQCLRPNPGLYLPLQGGIMTGNIDMNNNKILRLPLPVDSQEPLTLAYYTANIAPHLYNEGARARHSVAQAIPHNVQTTLALNSEDFDTDSIHDNAVNNSRLTCNTAGVYIITTQIQWETAAAGRRWLFLRLNGITNLGRSQVSPVASLETTQELATIARLAVTDYVEMQVTQNTGIPLNINGGALNTPILAMGRIGI